MWDLLCIGKKCHNNNKTLVGRVLVKKIIILMLVFLITEKVFAQSFSVPSTISGVTIGPSLARVYLTDLSGGFESCTVAEKKNAYSFDPSITGNEFMLSAILSAKVSKQKIMFQSIDCYMGYSKITHVYFCNTDRCE